MSLRGKALPPTENRALIESHESVSSGLHVTDEVVDVGEDLRSNTGSFFVSGEAASARGGPRAVRRSFRATSASPPKTSGPPSADTSCERRTDRVGLRLRRRATRLVGRGCVVAPPLEVPLVGGRELQSHPACLGEIHNGDDRVDLARRIRWLGCCRCGRPTPKCLMEISSTHAHAGGAAGTRLSRTEASFASAALLIRGRAQPAQGGWRPRDSSHDRPR